MASYKLMLDMISRHDLITGKETSEIYASPSVSVSENYDIFSDLPRDLSAMLISRKNNNESLISVNDTQQKNDSHEKKGHKESEKKVQTINMTGEEGSSENSTTEQGTIRWFNRDGKLFGYIETDEGKEIYFDDTSMSQDLEYPDIYIGLRVSFHTETKEIGQMACDISIYV
jgi:cold shock CspA family protein